MRTLRSLFLVGGGIALLVLVWHLGADSIASALTHVTWWQFVLVCLLQGLNVVIDAFAWRYALTGVGAPFHRLVAARLAGDAVSVPSLIVSKTAEVIAQALLLALGIVLAATTGVVGPSLRTAMV